MRWSNVVAKGERAGKNMDMFEELLDFLSLQKDTSMVYEKMEAVEKKKDEKEAEKKVEKQQVTKENPKEKTDDEGFTKVERSSRNTRGPVAKGPMQQASPAHPCDLCRGNHWLTRCPDFNKKSVEERIRFCESKKLCQRCMRWSHPTETCRFEGKCFVCNETHNTMLHREKAKETVADLVTLDGGSGQQA